MSYELVAAMPKAPSIEKRYETILNIYRNDTKYFSDDARTEELTASMEKLFNALRELSRDSEFKGGWFNYRLEEVPSKVRERRVKGTVLRLIMHLIAEGENARHEELAHEPLDIFFDAVTKKTPDLSRVIVDDDVKKFALEIDSGPALRFLRAKLPEHFGDFYASLADYKENQRDDDTIKKASLVFDLAVQKACSIATEALMDAFIEVDELTKKLLKAVDEKDDKSVEEVKSAYHALEYLPRALMGEVLHKCGLLNNLLNETTTSVIDASRDKFVALRAHSARFIEDPPVLDKVMGNFLRDAFTVDAYNLFMEGQETKKMNVGEKGSFVLVRGKELREEVQKASKAKAPF